MKDMLGNELVKGDLVAYGARSGNTGELRLGIIVNPEKSQMLSGTGHHRTWDWQNKKDVDEYYFEVGSSSGTGVHGSRLMKLGDEHELTACPYNPHIKEAYKALKEKATKWL